MTLLFLFTTIIIIFFFRQSTMQSNAANFQSTILVLLYVYTIWQIPI